MSVYSKVLQKTVSTVSLRNGIQNGNKFVLFNNNTKLVLLNQARCSHGRQMNIAAGQFYTKKYIDMALFQVTIVAIPFLLVIGYANFFIGRAELTEIPEGYEPKPHEYHKVISQIELF
jgi:hypothetical protein